MISRRSLICGALAADVLRRTARAAVADWNHFLLTGQSLSEGYMASPVPSLYTTQPYSNLQLSADANCHWMTVAPERPLIEDSEPGGCGTGKVNTLAAAMANNVTALSGAAAYQMLVSRNGVSGTAYSGLCKGTGPYSKAMAATTGQIAVAHSRAALASKIHKLMGIIVTHGEADFTANHLDASTYAADLVQWRADYDADAKARTGQIETTKFFVDQMASWGYYGYSQPVTAVGGNIAGVPIGQWQACRDHPLTHILAGPKYQMPYADGLHLSAAGQELLGEMHARAVYAELSGGHWVPLAPRQIWRDGIAVYVRWWVPAGALAIDTSTLADCGHGKGLELFDASLTRATLTADVTVSGDVATIPIPAGFTPAFVGNAYTGTGGANTGTAGAAHSNLRDTDSRTMLSGNHGWNWSVSFIEPVEFSWNPARASFFPHAPAGPAR